MSELCPVCKTPLLNKHAQQEKYFFECPRCGPYSLSWEANTDLGYYLNRDADASTKLSHALYKMTEREQWAMLKSESIPRLLEATALPNPREQLDNLILWLGKKQPGPGTPVPVSPQTEAAVGVPDNTALGFICSHAVNTAGLVEGVVKATPRGDGYVVGPLKLSFTGWGRFDELRRGRGAGRVAFMAMQFGDDDLDRIYRDCFVPAVAATGFQLKRLDEGQPAGLIDDRLRVEIRQARFLLADLTHQNRGAYWEAGFAEGLGKPVIYTCRKDAFDGTGTHFDTNHHLTVIWEPGKESEATEKLKATIRATLPEEATQSD